MEMENTKIEPKSTTLERTVIEVNSGSIDGALIYHVVSEVIAFLLYMHQQIPTILQDMTLEFDLLQTEFKELETTLSQGEMCPSLRRKQIGRKREVKLGINRVEKFMNKVSFLRTAFELIINEVPNAENVILILGASPRRPLHVYEMCFSRETVAAQASENLAKSRMAEGISKKVVRALISKGIGSASCAGPLKLFLLVKAPASFSMPLHFLPKRDLQLNKKIVPCKLQLKHRTYTQTMDASHCASKPTDLDSCSNGSLDLIWFQCRHVVKGLTLQNQLPEE